MKLPDISIGLKGGCIGELALFNMVSFDETYPDTPDWSQIMQWISLSPCMKVEKSVMR